MTPPRAPRVAVVILNWNGGAALLDCLESVRRSSYPEFVTVLVDNGSRDGSPALAVSWADARRARGEDVCVVRYDRTQAEAGGDTGAEALIAACASPGRLVMIEIGANLGFAAGNNVAIRYALALGFPYVMLLNNDAALEPATLAALVACLEQHTGWAGAAPKVVAASDPGRILCAGGSVRLWQARGVNLGRNRRDSPRWSGTRTTRHLSGCCVLYRAGFLSAAGLLDEDFFFFQEDVALSHAAARRGLVFGVDLDVRARHAEGGSLRGASPRSVYYANKYRLLLLKKCATRRQHAAAACFMVATRIVKFAALLLAGKPRSVAAEIRAYADFFAGRLAAHDRAKAAETDTKP